MAKRTLQSGDAVPMDPGERDKAVTIEQLNESTGGSGFPTRPWSTLQSPVWMKKIDLRAGERFKADQTVASYDTQWEMGYLADMDPDLFDIPKNRRLVYQGRVHEIVEASLIGRREGIELMTVAITGGEL